MVINTTGGTTFSPNTTINAGNYQTRYLGGLNTSGINTFSGTITNNAGNISLSALNAGGTTTFSNVISGSGQVNIEGSGTVNFSGANTYSGLTFITGTLQLGAINVIPDTPGVTLGGGTLRTGATTGFSETIGSLTVSANSAITLGSGVHTLTIANSSGNTWAGTTLTINNWRGTFGSSGTAAAGKIQVGSGGFSGGQLAKVQFTGFPVGAVITASGELVPSSAPTSISPTENGGFETGTTFAANGWTVVNSAATNGSKWLVGTSALTNGSYTFPLSGSRVGYIANNNATAWHIILLTLPHLPPIYIQMLLSHLDNLLI